jgi:hypothetical protein
VPYSAPPLASQHGRQSDPFVAARNRRGSRANRADGPLERVEDEIATQLGSVTETEHAKLEHQQAPAASMYAAAAAGPPPAGAGRREAAALVDADADKTAAASYQLGRRWSTPVRVKPAADKASNIGNKTNTIQSAALRHSYRAKLHHHHQQSATKDAGDDDARQPFRHKSVTSLRPTSSSASDSAFSQSQTTLETDSETIQRFSAADTLKRNNDAADNDRLSSNDGSTNSESRCYSEQDHFKIIWQNLSYTIPEKRFGRLIAFASKVRAKWPGAAAVAADETKHAASSPCPNSDNSFRRPFQRAPSVAPPAHRRDDRLGGHLEDGLGSPPEEEACTPAGLHEQKLAALSRQRRTIFSNLNGCVKSGQLTAILGPSGAGKTTFLKCLTNGITKGVSGSISIHSNTIDGGDYDGLAAPYKSSQHLKLCIIPQKGKCVRGLDGSSSSASTATTTGGSSSS